MKTAVTVLIIGLLCAITSSAMAGQPKPPDTLCLEWENASYFHHLAIEQSGKIYDKDYRIKTYVISGIDQYGVIVGSGYIARGTSTLLATYSGMHNGDTVSNYELKYNLKTKSGTIDYRYATSTDTAIVTGNDTVYNKGCRSLDIPPFETAEVQ